MSSPYYVPSGRLPAQAIVSTAACALLVVIPAWLYAWLTIHSPLVLLNWFAMGVFALVMGVAARQVARQAKARNPMWMGRLGLAIGVAEYDEGPTGCTVFHFPGPALVAMDVRGGSVGTIMEGDGLTDAICLAGGSLYGLEAATGVAANGRATGATGAPARAARAHHVDLALHALEVIVRALL